MDLEMLLRPLSGASVCGEDMMFSSEFDAIREARRFEDPSLSQGEWVTEIKEADWAAVVTMGARLLETRTKDLRLAVWMTEALARSRGLSGLAEGFALVDRLCEAYWAEIHPEAEEGDVELRVGNLDWLVNQSVRLVRETPLTASAKGTFSLLDLESARTLASVMERNPRQAEALAAEARVTMEGFDAARRDTDGQHFLRVMSAAGEARDAALGLRVRLDRLLGQDAPAFGALLDALEEVQQTLRRYASEAGVLAAAAAMPREVVPASLRAAAPLGGGPGELGAGLGGAVRSREQAIRQLQEIAAFFKRTEPHSPVAYLAEKAARWGSMSLHDWLRSVVKDDTALAHVEELLGVDMRRAEQGD